MDDIDMILLFKEYLGEVDLSFLEGADKKEKKQEEDQNE